MILGYICNSWRIYDIVTKLQNVWCVSRFWIFWHIHCLTKCHRAGSLGMRPYSARMSMASMACKICKQQCCKMLQAFFLKAMEVDGSGRSAHHRHHRPASWSLQIRSAEPSRLRKSQTHCFEERDRKGTSMSNIVQHCPRDSTGTLEQPKALWCFHRLPQPCVPQALRPRTCTSLWQCPHRLPALQSHAW